MNACTRPGAAGISVLLAIRGFNPQRTAVLPAGAAATEPESVCGESVGKPLVQ